jgi:hypothetical protein
MRKEHAGVKKETGNQKLAFLLTLCLLGAAVLAWVYWPRSSHATTPEELAEQALSGNDQAVQSRAALQLTRFDRREAAPPLRQVLREARHAEVRAAAIQGLGEVADFESVPELLRLCNDPSPLVRGRAGAALCEILGADFPFEADLPAAQRAEVIDAMRRMYDQMRRHPPPKYRS